jgi:two-component system nitrate/nitrite response regulator NarL
MSSTSEQTRRLACPQTAKLSVRTDAADSGSGVGSSSEFRILIVDGDLMVSHLLATTLSREGIFRASVVQPIDLLRRLDLEHADMVIIASEVNSDSLHEFELTQAVRRAHPDAFLVMLLNHSTRDSVLTAFRSGARGVFSREYPVAKLLECIEHVRHGYIWAAEQETSILLEAIRLIPPINMASAVEASLLSHREQQVAQAAARGKTNKIIASELGLSEHTVRNCLFRAFGKLGVSNRIELIFRLSVKGQTSIPLSPGKGNASDDEKSST